MAKARRQLILEAFKSRLEAITAVDGFQTNAGDAVFLGESVVIGPEADTAIAVVVGDEESRYVGANVFSVLPIEIHAFARADLDEPWLAAEAVLADIKRAIEIEDRTLGGVSRRIERRGTRAIDREPGATVVGISIGYEAAYVEAWGNP